MKRSRRAARSVECVRLVLSNGGVRWWAPVTRVSTSSPGMGETIGALPGAGVHARAVSRRHDVDRLGDQARVARTTLRA